MLKLYAKQVAIAGVDLEDLFHALSSSKLERNLI